MPFKSKSQARYMFSQHPDIAKEFSDKTPSIKSLPERVKKLKNVNKINTMPTKSWGKIKG